MSVACFQTSIKWHAFSAVRGNVFSNKTDLGFLEKYYRNRKCIGSVISSRLIFFFFFFKF